MHAEEHLGLHEACVIGYKVLTAVTMKSAIWDVMQGNLVEDHIRFDLLSPSSWSKRKPMNQQETNSKQSVCSSTME
jgi:hypothetical protein